MAYCPNCGAQVADNAAFCGSCGTPFGSVGQNQQAYGQQAYGQQPYYPPVQPYATGGLIAWSIITLLLCTIPGIVALVKTTSINSALTPEDQAQRIKSAKTWCIVGTVLGVLAVILAVIGAAVEN